MSRRNRKHAAPRAGESASVRRIGLPKALFWGILIGLVVAGLLAWYLLPRATDFKKVTSAPELLIPPTSIATPAQPTPAQPATTPPDSANYTFYDILPGNQAPKPLTPAPDKEEWWLQVAALKNAEDADALRAKLTLLNLNAVVQATTTGGAPLHRVRVGPFRGQDAAESASETLTVNNFEARLLKEPVTQ